MFGKESNIKVDVFNRSLSSSNVKEGSSVEFGVIYGRALTFVGLKIKRSQSSLDEMSFDSGEENGRSFHRDVNPTTFS